MIRAHFACAGLVLLAAVTSVVGNGSPRWEDTGKGYAKMSQYKRLASFFVNIDEKKLCDAKHDQIILFDANNCQGNIVGSTIATGGDCFRNMRWMQRRMSCWQPDTARSMFIRKTFPVNGTITLCDNAGMCFEDGYITMTLNKQPLMVMPKSVKDLGFSSQDMPQAPMGYCLNTFEHTFNDVWLSAKYDGGVMAKGLDGTITRIGACTPNETGNPMSDDRPTMPYDGLTK